MKKNSLLLILIGCCSLAYGQVSLGVKAGTQLNKVLFKGISTNPFKTNSTIGFHLGVFAQFDLTERFAIIPELQYIGRGFSDDTGPETTRVNLNYLEIPVLASFTPIQMFRIEAGPTLGYNIRTTTITNDMRTNTNKLFDKRTELGVTAGVRVTPADKIGVLVQYHYGLTPFDEIVLRDTNNVTTSARSHNTGIQLSVVYKLSSI